MAGLGALPAIALAQDRLQIRPGGEFKPIPIAIPPFLSDSPADAEAAASIAQVITNNLKRSGLFAPIDLSGSSERIGNIDTAPQFERWRMLSAEGLVVGRARRQDDGQLRAEIRMREVVHGED